MSGPLEGLRILDLATIVAGPFAATLLADYGAEVLKVELPGIGDGARNFAPFRDGKSLWWKVLNRNKKLMTLDLRKPEGIAIVKRLLERFDVVVENFRPGTLDRWGLTKEVMWEINPRLVVLRTTGFGQDGPYRERPAFARVFEAMAGLTYITGEPDGEPMHAGYPIGDAIGGLFGAIGILAACWKRARDPDAPGEEVDLSLCEATLRINEFLPIEYDQLGVVRQRSGNRNQYSAPSALYKTRDDHWVTLSGSTDAIFANNCRAIGRPDLSENPRFKTNKERIGHSAELNAIFADWCRAHDLEHVLGAFQQANGTVGPVYSIDQVFADPQIVARKAIAPVADVDFGTVAMQAVVPRFTRDKVSNRHSAGALGCDTEEILANWLGMDRAEQQRLRDCGAV
jgi:crotonobetainyl-CoA:carnitine CoA-transferase CaiB-like acyl-CoA transferase